MVNYNPGKALKGNTDCSSGCLGTCIQTLQTRGMAGGSAVTDVRVTSASRQA